MCSGLSQLLPFSRMVSSFSHMFSSSRKMFVSEINFVRALCGDCKEDRFCDSVWYCARVYSFAGGTAIAMFLHLPTHFSSSFSVHMFSESIFEIKRMSLSTLGFGTKNLQFAESMIKPKNCSFCAGVKMDFAIFMK